MNKYSLLYGILFSLALISGQQINAMGSTNSSRNFIKAFCYGLLGSQAALSIKKHDNNLQYHFSTAKPLNATSTQYILNILHAAYPELKDRNIKIVRNVHGWAAGSYKDVHYLFAPCTDQELEQAIIYHTNKTEKKITIVDKINNKWGIEDLSDKEFIGLSEQVGQAMTAKTLNVWRCTILHEGSHILHNDGKFTIRIPPILVPISIAALAITRSKASRLLIPTIIGSSIATAPLGFWEEVRADLQAIARTQDPEDLRAMSEFFINTQEFDYVDTIQSITHFHHIHPPHLNRAEYFARAALKLEEKQANQAVLKT